MQIILFYFLATVSQLRLNWEEYVDIVCVIHDRKKLISSVNTNVNTFIHFKYNLNAVDLEEYIQIFKVASY